MRTREKIAEVEQLSLDCTRLNQSRVLAGDGSPKVLVGGINHGDTPNFHTMHMIDMGASLVGITSDVGHALRPDRLWVHPEESLVTALRRLPSRWKPDFFWDAQAEQGHYFPVGLGELEIPTVVSFNHANLGDALLHMDGLFDCLIRPSIFMERWGDAYLPWGGSWGTMEERIRMYSEPPGSVERDVTVSCTIGTRGVGEESVRWKIMRELQEIAERRKDWKIVIAQELEQDQYFDLLARSKASINVGFWGAAMTYRPLEVIAQQAILIHADETAYGSEAKLSEFFPASWYVETRPGELEAAIERASGPDWDRYDIRQKLNDAYSYRVQYGKLFDLAASVKKKPKLSLKDWSRRACAINDLTGYPEFADVHRWALTDDDIASASVYPDKDWDVCLWQPQSNEERVRWRTELALRLQNLKDVYRKYAMTPVPEVLVPGTSSRAGLVAST